MKDKRQPLKKSPIAILLENHEQTITITKDMVGETVSYLSVRGALIAVDHYINDYKKRIEEQNKRLISALSIVHGKIERGSVTMTKESEIFKIIESLLRNPV